MVPILLKFLKMCDFQTYSVIVIETITMHSKMTALPQVLLEELSRRD